MELPIYQVDAFASEVFRGNPAAVMPLDAWLPEETLQALAMENNLSETAFYVACDQGYELRWFTPEVEVDLCGHATLAAAHVLFDHRAESADVIRFQTRSGELRVSHADQGITLDFPAAELVSSEVRAEVSQALGAEASQAVVAAQNPHAVVYVFESQAQVAALQPNFSVLSEVSELAIIASAPGETSDFVSRFFGPQVGIDEDPVTGSAHCSLVPYWAERLGSNSLSARQISSRGGDLACTLRDGRVFMSGQAVTFMIGTVFLS